MNPPRSNTRTPTMLRSGAASAPCLLGVSPFTNKSSERGGVSPLALGRKPSWEEPGGLRHPAQKCSIVGRVRYSLVFALLFAFRLTAVTAVAAADDKTFTERVAPIFEQHCVRCHNADEHKGGLSLVMAEAARKGGDSGAAFISMKPDDSLIVQHVSGDKPEMPKNAAPLSQQQITTLREWIAAGASWPDGIALKDRQFDGKLWWSLQSLARPNPTAIEAADNDAARAGCRSPIDAFVIAELREKGLVPSPEADRRTLYRRLSFDLHGLPPDPAEVDAFVADPDPTAYERLVDALLASPRYGERWARHWLDVVHYGDTHGYDKDKLRPNAWPYRDYVVRSFNEDKPYDRFVLEQLAGDVLWPETADGQIATGFIAAGPWDFIGHAEVPESKIDGKIARNLDRDDMVTTAMNTFCSLTVQCARCHNHKFDPVTQADYYRLQAVFAALDRADRMFDTDPAVSHRRAELLAEQKRLKSEEQRLTGELVKLGGEELKSLDQKMASTQQAAAGQRRPEYGYHSGIERDQNTTKWVQVDLGREVAIKSLALVGCWDDFNGIGDGFGFPVRFKVELSSDPDFKVNVIVALDRTAEDVTNPGTKLWMIDLAQRDFGKQVVPGRATSALPPSPRRGGPGRGDDSPATPDSDKSPDPQAAPLPNPPRRGEGTRQENEAEEKTKAKAEEPLTLALSPQSRGEVTKPEDQAKPEGEAKKTARYVRVTATKLAPRMNDFIFALAELSVFDTDGKNVAARATVTALDSIEAPVRWAKQNLVDGIFTGQSADDVKQLREQRAALLERLVPLALRDEMRRVEAALVATDGQLKTLPAPQYVYAGMIHHGGGTFSGTGSLGGKPRPIHILKRGDVTTPGDEVQPGIVPLRPNEPGEFTLVPHHVEGDRRVAFAKWIVDEQHPLTWRSVVNRLWQHHLGRGLVDTPNDFGRMGQLPTHPELLDWLAIEFRDGGRSLKRLHRQIVTSATYRQTSTPTPPGLPRWSQVSALLSGASEGGVRSELSGDAEEDGVVQKPASHRGKPGGVATKEADQLDSSNTLLWRSNRRKLDAESLRDAMLLVAGKLDDRMGGPAFQDFVIEKPEHSPHYEYHLHDPEDPKSHRRSIYRFLVRSQTQPFMTTLDCADPSMIVEKRNETVTALQALALRNNKLVLSMSNHMAQRITAASPDERQRIALAFRLALGRSPTAEEQTALTEYATQHGLPQTCRVILNLNEFAFVD